MQNVIIKCPKCNSLNIKVERRRDGDAICDDCHHKDKTVYFSFDHVLEQGE